MCFLDCGGWSEPPRVEDVIMGDTVFFEVEDTIFQVARNRLTENSKIFADMFLLPGAEGSHEGQDRETPIVLAGYMAADFAALVKVLYPSYEEVIAGSFGLGKEEWVGVLNLSTRWQMRMLRNLAIRQISSLPLTSIEKVRLARAHRVGKWLSEGLSEIVAKKEADSPEEYESILGPQTALRVVWIQHHLFSKAASQVTLRSHLQVTLAMLACAKCNSALEMENWVRNCCSCGKLIEKDDALHTVCADSTAKCITQASGAIQVYVNFSKLRCKHCLKHPRPWLPSLACPKCRALTSCMTDSMKLMYTTPVPPPDDLAIRTKVSEVFKNEITSLEDWSRVNDEDSESSSGI